MSRFHEHFRAHKTPTNNRILFFLESSRSPGRLGHLTLDDLVKQRRAPIGETTIDERAHSKSEKERCAVLPKRRPATSDQVSLKPISKPRTVDFEDQVRRAVRPRNAGVVVHLLLRWMAQNALRQVRKQLLKILRCALANGNRHAACVVVTALLTAAWASSARRVFAQEAREATSVLTEADVVRYARSRSSTALVAEANFTVAAATRQQASVLANPTLSWLRETGNQDTFTATLPFDLARTRTARRQADAAMAWAEAERALAVEHAALQSVWLFYETLAARQRVAIQARRVERMEEALRVVRARVRAGEAGGYAEARLILALATAQTDAAEARLIEAQNSHALLTTLGFSRDDDSPPAAQLHLEGSLAFVGADSRTTTDRTTTEQNTATRDAAGRNAEDTSDFQAPPMAAASRAVELATDASNRARWTWTPRLELVVGVQRASQFSGGSGDGSHNVGLVAGINLDIPLFDHGQTTRAGAEALRRQLEANREALRRTLGLRIHQAQRQLTTAQAELDRHEAMTNGPLQVLLQASERGYHEGERTVLERLDAEEIWASINLQRLALQLAAKRAEAALRAATGVLFQ